MVLFMEIYTRRPKKEIYFIYDLGNRKAGKENTSRIFCRKQRLNLATREITAGLSAVFGSMVFLSYNRSYAKGN